MAGRGGRSGTSGCTEAHLIDNTLEVLLTAVGSRIQNWQEPSSGWRHRLKYQGQE